MITGTTGPIRAVVLGDTHVHPGSSRRLPGPVHDLLNEADVILHAGDVVTADLLDELGRYAPVHAVLGNNDHELVGILPETLVLDLAGVSLAMVHDSGARRGRPSRLRRRFPDADVVVFGHSHDPVAEPGIDGQLLLNPGSPTWKRRAPHPTVAVLDLADGHVRHHAIVPVSPVSPVLGQEADHL